MPEFYHAPPLIDAKTKAFIATPAINVMGNHFASMVKALPLLMLGDVAAHHFLLMDQCHVDDARNMCVGFFLSTNCDQLVFLDADVGFPPETLLRLIRAEGDIVAGVYPRKEAERTWPVKFEEGVVPELGTDGLIRNGVLGLPTGFMKISRHVIERMAAERKDRSPLFGDKKCPIIFERGYRDGERLSGDYAFCLWARELGFNLALDPWVPFTHCGPFRFCGRLYDDMEKETTTRDAA